ncbi:NAD-dependent epimerase/dehydratase family protein [Tsukamurella ocularis]|uniref:NAD-dependent epimerase/dehydratase family protein n=1 Tax=Tsukamurella ocularis TaxID=1970234 RepID=UPI0021691267|nr:NAD-dependent epimerase/dehydratase family protein [Tsukamurella ocularis]MCS3778905.1 dihydroflavonol-4-reductase [Tsukamurella ocularis]MCS3787475.1 dihydroflavonol-4-reductase [Tsukamurella ocularis]MCS3851588.1 dihydroflavonol-4-reductase [Tsukamurella ocularis]
MRVAVTGAAGFVGGNLLQQLVEQGHEVVAIDRASSAHAPEGVRWVQASVLEPSEMRAALEGVEVVYHLVAMITLRMQDEAAWRLNTEGVRVVARAALDAGVRKMVHLSSIHAFDQDLVDVIDETAPRSERPEIPVYDRSKWAGEQELRKVIDDGLDATICNPTGVWGPADHGAALSRLNRLAHTAARGRMPAFVSKAGFDLVDVRDVATGVMLAAEKGRTGENYLLGGEFTPIIDAMRLSAQAAGKSGPRVAVPIGALAAIMPVLEPINARLGSDVLSKAALGPLFASPLVDISKARNELGYAPRTMATTATELVQFFAESGRLD